jgi:hypothetical protein
MPPPYYDGPPVTQPSSISVSTAGIGHDNGSRRTAVAAIIGVLIGICFLTTALIYRTSRKSASPDGVAEGPTASVTGEPSPPLTNATPFTPPPTAQPQPVVMNPPPVPAPVVEAVPDAGIQQPVVQRSSPQITPPRPGPAPKQPTTAPPGTPKTGGEDCSTPYWYDASGVKHYKQQCLGNIK